MQGMSLSQVNSRAEAKEDSDLFKGIERVQAETVVSQLLGNWGV